MTFSVVTKSTFALKIKVFPDSNADQAFVKINAA